MKNVTRQSSSDKATYTEMIKSGAAAQVGQGGLSPSFLYKGGAQPSTEAQMILGKVSVVLRCQKMPLKMYSAETELSAYLHHILRSIN